MARNRLLAGTWVARLRRRWMARLITATLGGAHGGAARDSAVADGQCLRQTRGGPGRNSAVADDRGAGAFGAAAGLARA